MCRGQDVPNISAGRTPIAMTCSAREADETGPAKSRNAESPQVVNAFWTPPIPGAPGVAAGRQQETPARTRSAEWPVRKARCFHAGARRHLDQPRTQEAKCACGRVTSVSRDREQTLHRDDQDRAPQEEHEVRDDPGHPLPDVGDRSDSAGRDDQRDRR